MYTNNEHGTPNNLRRKTKKKKKTENIEQLGIPDNQRQIALVRFYRPAKQNQQVTTHIVCSSCFLPQEPHKRHHPLKNPTSTLIRSMNFETNMCFPSNVPI